MFSRIKEAVRILSAKPAEPEVKSYFRITLYSGKGERLLEALVLNGFVYDEEQGCFRAEKPDGKILEIFMGSGNSLIFEEVREQDPFIYYS